MDIAVTQPPADMTEAETREPSPAATTDDDLVAESLVEEISIDGMCGVY